MLLMGKSTISMAIVHCYVSLPEDMSLCQVGWWNLGELFKPSFCQVGVVFPFVGW